jgi:hypothetical protein
MVDGPRLLRLGGRSELPSGEVVAWSVADGGRGRRWRETATRDGVLIRAVLFEADRSGRVERLELVSSAGLLTLHPADDDSAIHGNVVTPTGIRHLAFEWHDQAVLFVEGSPAAAAIAMGRLARRVPIGATERVSTIRIDGRLDPRPTVWDVTRSEERTWRLVEVSNEASRAERTVRIDDNGLVDMPGSVSWPLET